MIIVYPQLHFTTWWQYIHNFLSISTTLLSISTTQNSISTTQELFLKSLSRLKIMIFSICWEVGWQPNEGLLHHNTNGSRFCGSGCIFASTLKGSPPKNKKNWKFSKLFLPLIRVLCGHSNQLYCTSNVKKTLCTK